MCRIAVRRMAVRRMAMHRMAMQRMAMRHMMMPRMLVRPTQDTGAAPAMHHLPIVMRVSELASTMLASMRLSRVHFATTAIRAHSTTTASRTLPVKSAVKAPVSEQP